MSKKEAQKSEFLFGKKNYIIMLVGIAIISLGFILIPYGYHFLTISRRHV